MKVKPLAWREARVSDKWPRYDADSAFGHYEVLQWSDGSFGGSVPVNREFSCENLDAAKKICQADYESRVMTLFEETKDSQE
jgi:hypothetical protein